MTSFHGSETEWLAKHRQDHELAAFIFPSAAPWNYWSSKVCPGQCPFLAGQRNRAQRRYPERGRGAAACPRQSFKRNPCKRNPWRRKNREAQNITREA